MNLADQLLHQIDDPTIACDKRAQLRCQLSKTLEESGDYEGARGAMGELWSRVGERPVLDGLNQATTAEVLLQIGRLTGCLGSAKQIEGAQEIAKDLITEGMTIFESLPDTKKVLEATTDLAVCYWRQGAFDEARATLRDVLSRLTHEDVELRALAMLRSAMVEKVASRLHEALRIHAESKSLFEAIENHALKGKFHNEFGTVLKDLGAAEHREDYIDRALIEYAAASFHFEQAGHERYRARVENNLGFLFSMIDKYEEAHAHLNRARELFVRLKDSGSVAQVDETRARVLLAEGRDVEAEEVVRASVVTLEKGDESSLLAEALTTHGVALARTNRRDEARAALGRAVEVAERAGDLEGAGQAALALVEELAESFAPAELTEVYERAAGLLANAQHPGINERLLRGARRVLRALVEAGVPGPATAGASPESRVEGSSEKNLDAPASWEGFSFRNETRRYERFLIERALKDAGGVVTRAAHLLGFKHHYSLIALINSRHKNLLHARSPVLPRRRSVFRDATSSRAPRRVAQKQRARPASILHVEDNKLVAHTVRDSLESRGWVVDSCAEGITALSKIAGGGRYDLLLLDNDLPGVDGLELLRQARKLPHRRRTPVVIFSARDCETEAWRAGADAFLRKPEDLLALEDTIARLLNVESKQ